MKKLVFLFLLVTCWQVEALGVSKAVFPYNYPDKSILKDLVMENSPKGKAYRDYLLYAVNLGLVDTTLTITHANIDILFNNLFSEEFTLPESGYMNSGYDSTLYKIVPSVGHAWKGFVWMLKIGSYTIPLIKTDCGNVLIAKAIRAKVFTTNINHIQQEPEQSFSPPKEKRVFSPKANYVPPKVENIVVKTNSSPKKEIRIGKTGKIVIPIAAIGLATACYFLGNRNSSPNTSSGSPYRGGTRNNPSGQGQDPPPSGDDSGGQGQDPPPSGDDSGGPVDPPPSGD